MRNNKASSHSTMLRDHMGWWRLAPFVTVLIMLLGTAALGAAIGTPGSNSAASAKTLAFARAAQ